MLSSRMPEWKLRQARMMRARPSTTELALWDRLKGRKLGPKFRRKCPVAGYIVDFVAPLDRLVVEIDRGGITPERDAVMRGYGLVVVRVPQALVETDVEAAVAIVAAAVAGLPARPLRRNETKRARLLAGSQAARAQAD